MRALKSFFKGIIISLIAFMIYSGYSVWMEKEMLRQVIARLSADSRAAEVVVTSVKTAPDDKTRLTTIRFVEYDTLQKPLTPKYFTFKGEIIQFQSLVIRFDDFYVQKGDRLRGKSALIFLKAFSISTGQLESFDINKVNEIPSGYLIHPWKNRFERKIWEKFWQYALHFPSAPRSGVKNAQVEAPGTKFLPGYVYTLKIEHDGGLRIDAVPLPDK